MRVRRVLLLILLALATTAFAGYTWDRIPPGLRSPIRSTSMSGRGWVSHNTSGRPSAARVAVAPPIYRFSAPVVSARAIDQAGQVTELDLAETIDLSDPLSLPPGTVDVELDLGGPLVLRASHSAGLAARNIDVSTLLVAIDAPEALDEAPEIIVDLDVAAALSAATDEQAATMIQDGALGLSR